MASATYKETEKQKNLLNRLLQVYFMWVVITPSGVDTHADFMDKSNFKKTGALAFGRRMPGLTRLGKNIKFFLHY